MDEFGPLEGWEQWEAQQRREWNDIMGAIGAAMQIDITSIMVLTGGGGTDRITLRTNLPPSLWPWTEPLSLSAEVAHGAGEQYVWDNFPGVPVQVIDINRTEEQ